MPLSSFDLGVLAPGSGRFLRRVVYLGEREEALASQIVREWPVA